MAIWKSKFSPDYKTYDDWLKSQDVTKQYIQRIVRGHSRFPSASLSQLRGHASKGKRPVSKINEIVMGKRLIQTLTSVCLVTVNC